MPGLTRYGGAVFIAVAASIFADQLGMSWWKSSGIFLLVAFGLIAMLGSQKSN